MGEETRADGPGVAGRSRAHSQSREICFRSRPSHQHFSVPVLGVQSASSVQLCALDQDVLSKRWRKEKRRERGGEGGKDGGKSGFLSQQVAALAAVGTMADFLPPGGLVELITVGRKYDLLSSRTS